MGFLVQQKILSSRLEPRATNQPDKNIKLLYLNLQRMKPITWILKQKPFMWPQLKIFLWKLIQTLNGYRIKTISMNLMEFHYMLRLLHQQYGKIFQQDGAPKEVVYQPPSLGQPSQIYQSLLKQVKIMSMDTQLKSAHWLEFKATYLSILKKSSHRLEHITALPITQYRK